MNNSGATEQEISAAVARARAARGEAENERSRAAAARGDEGLAGAAMAGANRENRVRTDRPAEPAYDSAERRQRLAASLEDHPDREAVNARLVADRHQGTPPSAAVQSKETAGKTSKMKAPSRGRTIERGGLER